MLRHWVLRLGLRRQESMEPAWILEHVRKEKIAAAVHQKKELEIKLGKIRAKELRQKQRYEDGEAYHKKIVCAFLPPRFDVIDQESRSSIRAATRKEMSRMKPSSCSMTTIVKKRPSKIRAVMKLLRTMDCQLRALTS